MNPIGLKIQINSSIYKLPGSIISYTQLLEYLRLNFAYRISEPFDILYKEEPSVNVTIRNESDFQQVITQAKNDLKRNIKLQIQLIHLNQSTFDAPSSNQAYKPANKKQDEKLDNLSGLLEELEFEDFDQVQLCHDFQHDDPLIEELSPYQIQLIQKSFIIDNSFTISNESLSDNSVNIVAPENMVQVDLKSLMQSEPLGLEATPAEPNQKPESIISLDESAIVFIRSENPFINKNYFPNLIHYPSQSEVPQKINYCNLYRPSTTTNQPSELNPSSTLAPPPKEAVNGSCCDYFYKSQSIYPDKLIKLSLNNEGKMEQTNTSLRIEPLAAPLQQANQSLFSLSDSKQNQSADLHSHSQLQKIQIGFESRSDPLGSQSTIFVDNEIENQQQQIQKIPFIQVNSSNHTQVTRDSKSSLSHPEAKVINQLSNSQNISTSITSSEQSQSTQQYSFLSAGIHFFNKIFEFSCKSNPASEQQQQNSKQPFKRLFSLSDKDESSLPQKSLFHSQGLPIINRFSLQPELAPSEIFSNNPRYSAPPIQQQLSTCPLPKRSSDQCLLVGHLQAKVLQAPDKSISIISKEYFSQFISFSNKGRERWPENVHLRCIQGIFEDQSFPLDSAEPSEVSSVQICLQSPNQAGTYINSFKLCYVNRQCELQYFGPKITFDLKVVHS